MEGRIKGLIEALVPPAHADMVPMTAVGVDLTPLPEGVPTIRMERELVEISLFPMFAVVEAEFEMVNRGPATEIEVGFPCIQPDERGSDTAPSGPLMDFSAEADGVACPCDRRKCKNATFPWWQVWTQRFGEGATTVLKVRYWTPLVNYRGVSVAPFIYVLRTGRYWEGTIGKAVIRVRGADAPVASIVAAHPPGWRAIDDDTIEWEFTDLDPEEDIQLLISPLCTAADFLGLEFTPVDELHKTRPEEGREVTVGGYFWDDPEDEDAEAILCSERSRDMNVAIPDCFPAFAVAGRLTEVRLDRTGATVEIAKVPDIENWGYWQAFLIYGTVAYEGDELLLRARRMIKLESSGEPRFAPDLLRWAADRDWMRLYRGRDERQYSARWPKFAARVRMSFDESGTGGVRVEDWLQEPEACKMPRREVGRERLPALAESERKPPPVEEEIPPDLESDYWWSRRGSPPEGATRAEQEAGSIVAELVPSPRRVLPPEKDRLARPWMLGRLGPLAIARVEGYSSYPDLAPGDLLFAWKWHGPLRVGDTILIRTPGAMMVKRISSLDGDGIEVGGNGLWGTVVRSSVIARVFYVKRGRR